MRLALLILTTIGFAAASWTTREAWGGRSPIGKERSTMWMALGRLPRREEFTPRGWRYRPITIVLYVITMALGYALISTVQR